MIILCYDSGYGQIIFDVDAKRPYKAKKYFKSPFNGLVSVARIRSFKTLDKARQYLGVPVDYVEVDNED